MAYEWLRLYKDIRDDHKLQTIPPEMFRQLINLWTVALEARPFGRLPKGEEIAWILRKKPQEIAKILAFLRQNGLLDEDESSGLLVPHNWDARQYQADHSGAERVRSFRERQREIGLMGANVTRKGNVTGNVTSNGLGNVTGMLPVTTPDTDTDTDTDIDIILSPRKEAKEEHNLEGRGVRGDPLTRPPEPPGNKTREKTGNKTPKHGTTIPEDFRASTMIEANYRYAFDMLPGASKEDVDEITERFILRAEASGIVYKNWLAAWKYWIRNERKWGKGYGGNAASNGSGPTGIGGNGSRPAATSIGKPDDNVARKYAGLLGGSIPRARQD